MNRLRNMKGFTLLELIIVIVIIGVLATLGLTQYGRFTEKARGGEAKSILGDIRKMAYAYYMENPSGFVSFNNAAANIGSAANEAGKIPGVCSRTHHFSYGVLAAGTAVTITATRCGAGGKTVAPAAIVGGTIVLVSDVSGAAPACPDGSTLQGNDCWVVGANW